MRRFVQAFGSLSSLREEWPASVGEAMASLPEHYNIGQADDAWVLRSVDGALCVSRMRWGMIPRWSKTAETPYTTVTARLERASRSRIFGKPWQTQHCLIPMNGYYKWDRTVRPHVPHFIQPDDGQILCAAGLWERWEREESAIESFAILTHPNSSIPAPLTPDGPVFVSDTVAWLWLTGPQLLAGTVLRMATTPPLTSYSVSNAYRDRRRSDYTLIEPRSVSDYLMPEPDALSDDDDGDLLSDSR